MSLAVFAASCPQHSRNYVVKQYSHWDALASWGLFTMLGAITECCQHQSNDAVKYPAVPRTAPHSREGHIQNGDSTQVARQHQKRA